MTLNFSYEILNSLHNRAPRPKVKCSVACAPTSLKIACAIDNPWRGIRTIAESGLNIKTKEEAYQLLGQEVLGKRREPTVYVFAIPPISSLETFFAAILNSK